MRNPTGPKRKKTNGPPPAIGEAVRADEVYRLRELGRRLGWREHAMREARKAGLPIVTFGRTKFVLGQDVLDFFQRLRDKQHGPGATHRESERGLHSN